MAGSQRLLYRPDASVSLPKVSARCVRGDLRLRAEVDAVGRTYLAERHAGGAFHLSKPYWDGRTLMVQWINPTAGIFAGDVLQSEVTVGRGASLLVTTPSATRIHTRVDPHSPPGEQNQTFRVERGALLEVQPEWLIPQRGSAFQQRTVLEVEEGASLFYAELLAPGRVAHGESLEFASLDLRTRLSVAGKLVSQERLLAGTQHELWMLQATTGQPLFTATLWLVLPDKAATVIPHLRQQLGLDKNGAAGATQISESVIGARLAATSGLLVRKGLRELRHLLSELDCLPETAMRKL